GPRNARCDCFSSRFFLGFLGPRWRSFRFSDGSFPTFSTRPLGSERRNMNSALGVTLTSGALGVGLLAIAIWVWIRKAKGKGKALLVVCWLMLFAGLFLGGSGTRVVSAVVNGTKNSAGVEAANVFGVSLSIVMLIGGILVL